MKQGTGDREQGTGQSGQLAGHGKHRLAGIIAFAVACCVWGRAQEIRFGGERAVAARGHVAYAAEVAEVAAGKPAVVELRFKVDEGFHVNSHTPLSEMLIPTALTMEAPVGVKVLEAEYPKGSRYKLQVGDGETLDVYQGEFRVSLRVVVPRGSSTLKGGLRYQACDHAACYPPKTLPVSVLVTGK